MSIRIDYQEFTASSKDPYIDRINSSADGDHSTVVCSSAEISSKTNSNSTNIGTNNPTFDTTLPCYGYANPLQIVLTYGVTSYNGAYAKGFTLEFDSAENFATVVEITAARGQITQSATVYPQTYKKEYYELLSLGITIQFETLTFAFTHCVSPQTQVSVISLYPGRVTTWTGDDLTSFPVITQECNPVGTELPYGISEFTLRLTGSKPRFRRWDKLFIYHNNTLMAKHYIDEAKRDGDLYHVKGFDVLGVLDDMPFDGMYFDPSQHTGGYTVEDCALIAMTNQDGDPPLTTLTFPSDLIEDDDYYYDYNQFSGFIPSCSRREALHRVIEAGHLTARVQPDGQISLRKKWAAGTTTLDNQYLFIGSSFEHKSPYTGIEFERTGNYYRESGDPVVLYNGIMPAGSQRLVFDSPVVRVMHDNATITGYSYGTTYNSQKFAAWIDLTPTNASNPVTVYGYECKGDKATFKATYVTDTDIPRNVLKIGGNTLNRTDAGTAISEISGYYGAIYQSDKWTGKLLYAAFGANGPVMGKGYALTVPGKGTITGWLTKAILTLSESNRYVEATITGVFSEE